MLDFIYQLVDFVSQVEDSLLRHGAGSALPYWDWTFPISSLPELFTSETFYDALRDEVRFNPFARGEIQSLGGYTVRDVQPELTSVSRDGQHSVLFDEVLLALEQTDYCDFEVNLSVCLIVNLCFCFIDEFSNFKQRSSSSLNLTLVFFCVKVFFYYISIQKSFT